MRLQKKQPEISCMFPDKLSQNVFLFCFPIRIFTMQVFNFRKNISLYINPGGICLDLPQCQHLAEIPHLRDIPFPRAHSTAISLLLPQHNPGFRAHQCPSVQGIHKERWACQDTFFSLWCYRLPTRQWRALKVTKSVKDFPWKSKRKTCTVEQTKSMSEWLAGWLL